MTPTRISVLTNIPNPYNQHLFSSLAATEHLAHVNYQGAPSTEGRAWRFELQAYESVTPGSLRGAATALRLARTSDAVVFSGNYTRRQDVLRLAALIGLAGPSVFWGERLRPGGRSVRAARRLVLRRFTAALAVGSWAVDSYREVLGPSASIHVLPYTTTQHRPVRQVPADTPTFGFVGSLTHRKGLDVVLSALAGLPASRRPVLEVVGSGQQGKAWRDQALSAGVHAAWLGELSQEETDRHRSRWWAQLVPSRYDGWGVVVSESLASGVPVLASTHTGAALDLVRDGVSGRLIASPKDWSQALLDYCSEDRMLRAGSGARSIGQEVAAEAAAPFLVEVLAEPDRARNFVDEAWARVRERLR